MEEVFYCLSGILVHSFIPFFCRNFKQIEKQMKEFAQSLTPWFIASLLDF